MRHYLYIPGIALIIAAGMAEATYGWLQLLGLSASRNAMFPVTGTFYNPGPLCAFLAVTLPLCASCVLGGHVPKPLRWAAKISIILILSLMPSLLGRTGWIAAAAGMIPVMAVRRPQWLPHGRTAVAAAVALAAVGAAVLWLKPASAFGRLQLWITGLAAMTESPLTGVGWYRVAGALGRAQERYFAANPGSPLAAVAGAPEYAFNEYLQIGIAFGIPAMLLFIAILWLAARGAMRAGLPGGAGAVTAFAIVCMASYPLQFAESVAAAALLLILAVAADCRLNRAMRLTACAAVAVAAIAGSISTLRHAGHVAEWARLRYAYIHQLRQAEIHVLDSLAAVYAWEPRFAFDYGKALRQSGRFEESTAVLRRGMMRSSDPMFLNLIGRNFADMGECDSAAHYFRRSAARLPGRLYPLYLMACLYTSPQCHDPDSLTKACRTALELRPKVGSPAVSQMRLELKQMLDSLR